LADRGSIVITFDEKDGEAVPRFVPGSVLSGNAAFAPKAETKVQGIAIEIGWRTEGKGNEDQETVWDHKEELAEDQRRLAPEASGARFAPALLAPMASRAGQAMALPSPGVAVTRPFRCKLPDSPWSYAGKIVSIVWEVTVQLDIPWAKDIKAVRRFTLRPEP
jgi:hypothetical protein